EVRDLVPGLTVVEVDLDGARRSPDRPEQSVRGEARIVVDELVRVRRKGVNLTPIDIESDERERAVVSLPVRATEGALHEAHVGIEQQLLFLAAVAQIGRASCRERV